MGTVLLVGGVFGSAIGVRLFSWLQSLGQIDLIIQLSYVIMLGIIGVLMMVESIRTILQAREAGKLPRTKLHQHHLLHRLPFKMRFRKSRLYISALMPFIVGILVGVLSAIMGVGGGFVMIPAMVFLLGMPTAIIVGTSIFLNYFCHCQCHNISSNDESNCGYPTCFVIIGRRGNRSPDRSPDRSQIAG